MPYIKVNTSALGKMRSVVSDARRETGQIKDACSRIASTLDWEVSSKRDINYQLRNIQRQMESCSSRLNKVENFLAYAEREYSDLNPRPEKDSLPSAGTKGVAVNSKHTSVDQLQKNDGSETVGGSAILAEAVKGMRIDMMEAAPLNYAIGLVSETYDYTENLQKGDYGEAIKNYANIGKTTYNTVSTIFKNAENLKKAAPIMTDSAVNKNWRRLLSGTGSYFDKTTGVASKASSVSARLYNNWQKTTIKEIGGITVLDVAVSGISNVIDNTEEYNNGEISRERAYAEIIGETAVDVVTDVALTAGAAAVLAATVGAAPVIGVAALAMVAGVTLDAVTGAITNGEKDFSEAVSDFFLDIGEQIGNGVASLYQSITGFFGF